jgi:hypothetical protein
VGTYDAERYPFQPTNKAGLDFSGNARGVSTLLGSFEVLEAVFNQDGSLQTYAVNFIQYEDKNPTK